MRIVQKGPSETWTVDIFQYSFQDSGMVRSFLNNTVKVFNLLWAKKKKKE